MKESSGSETVTTPPKVQKFERMKTIEKEHKDALQKALSLNIPHAVPTEDAPPQDEAEPSEARNENEDKKDESTHKTNSPSSRTNWDQVVEKLFKKNESGELVIKRDVVVESQSSTPSSEVLAPAPAPALAPGQ